MMPFDSQSFQKFTYTQEQIKHYISNAERDFSIAKTASDSNVVYRFCYDAVIKLGIAVIAKQGYKVRSVPGHHMKILEKLGDILHLKDEVFYLDRVRRQRNVDLYDGGIDFSEKDAGALMSVVSAIFKKGT